MQSGDNNQRDAKISRISGIFFRAFASLSSLESDIEELTGKDETDVIYDAFTEAKKALEDCKCAAIARVVIPK